jgi:hypothetical protein
VVARPAPPRPAPLLTPGHDREFLSGAIYCCSECSTHITSQDELVSKVCVDCLCIVFLLKEASPALINGSVQCHHTPSEGYTSPHVPARGHALLLSLAFYLAGPHEWPQPTLARLQVHPTSDWIASLLLVCQNQRRNPFISSPTSGGCVPLISSPLVTQQQPWP